MGKKRKCISDGEGPPNKKITDYFSSRYPNVQRTSLQERTTDTIRQFSRLGSRPEPYSHSPPSRPIGGVHFSEHDESSENSNYALSSIDEPFDDSFDSSEATDDDHSVGEEAGSDESDFGQSSSDEDLHMLGSFHGQQSSPLASTNTQSTDPPQSPDSGPSTVHTEGELCPDKYIIDYHNLDVDEDPSKVFSIYKLKANERKVIRDLKKRKLKQVGESQRKGKFIIHIYSYRTHTRPAYEQLLKYLGIAGSEMPQNRRTDFLMLMSCLETKSLYAVCTGKMWSRIMKYVDFSFPEVCAKRLLDADTINTIKSGSLVGPVAAMETNYREGFRYIPFLPEVCSHYVNGYSADVRKTSSLFRLKALQPASEDESYGRLVAEIGKGHIKFRKQTTLNALLEILMHLSKISNGEPTKGLDHKEEKDDNQKFYFYRFIKQAFSEEDELNEKLTKEFCDVIKQPSSKDSESTFIREFVIDHTRYHDWRTSPKIVLKKAGSSRELKTWSAAPTFREVIEALRSHNIDTENSMKNLKIQFYTGGKLRGDNIMSYLQGKLQEFFKKGKHWFLITAEYLNTLEEIFTKVIKETYLSEDDEGFLPLQWNPKVLADFRPSDLGRHAKLEKSEYFCKYLSKKKWSLLKEDRASETSSLRSSVTCPFTFVESSEITEDLNKLLKKNKDKKFDIEEAFNSSDVSDVANEIEKIFQGDRKLADALLTELKKPRAILESSQGIERHFSTPRFKVKNAFVPRTLFLDPEKAAGLYKFLRCSSCMREGEYNESFMLPPEVNAGYLVGDRIYTPFFKVELCDILLHKKGTTYLYHVKEDLGRPSTIACSQIKDAANLLHVALNNNGREDIIHSFWKAAVEYNGKAYYRLKMKEAMPNFEKFKDLFTKNKVVFVFAFWHKEPDILKPKEVKTRMVDILDNLEVLRWRDVLEEIQCTQYGDFTDTFRLMSMDKFVQMTKEKLPTVNVQSAKEMYRKIQSSTNASKSSSVLARMEITELYQSMQRYPFGFKIMQISSCHK